MRVYLSNYLFSLTAFFVFASPTMGAVETSTDARGTTYRVHVEGADFERVQNGDNDYLQATLRGTEGYQGIHYEVGKPAIPVVRLLVKGDDVSVKVGEVKLLSQRIEPLNHIPAGAPRVKIKGHEVRPLSLAKVYESDQSWPAVPFKVEDAGSIRGVKQSLVTLYPMTVRPRSKAYYLRSHFTVTAKVAEAASSVEKPEAFAFIVGRKFAQSEALASYIDFKKDMGFHTEVLIVGQDGVFAPDHIRRWLQGLLKSDSHQLRYALIIGDANDVPGASSSNISGITDHYYRAIDTNNYRTDINGPDIGVGRVAVADHTQLQAVLEKYRRYQEGNFSSQAWFKGASFLATNDNYNVAEGSHNYVIDTHTAPAGYAGVFPDAFTEGGDKLYAITYNVSSSETNRVMRMGRSIVNYSGHGARTYWDAPRVTQSDVRKMNDADALPFVISNACITGDFRTSESFGETWQRHPKGAIMFWGSMDNTYWDEDDILERRMYDGIFASERAAKPLPFDYITQNALSAHWAHYGGGGLSRYYWETYVSFGDPSIRLRTGPTSLLRLEGRSQFDIGDELATFTVTDASTGAPHPHAQVGLRFSESDQSLVRHADENGRVSFDLSAFSTAVRAGQILVYGKNAVIYRQAITIQ